MSKKTSPDPPVKKNAFVHKLYSMLNDPKLSHLIWWTRNEESNTFALYPGKEFANALTGYFKHGNVASFVRQLHMYGFHKVSDPQAGENSIPSQTNININNGNPKDSPPIWEFKHSSGKFKKNDERSLVYIKRRSSSNSSRNNPGYNSENETNVLIPTSAPSPSSYDNLPRNSYHFSQPPHPGVPHPQPTLAHAGHLYYQVLPNAPPPVAGPTSIPSHHASPYLPLAAHQTHPPYHHIQYTAPVPYPYASSPVPLDHLYQRQVQATPQLSHHQPQFPHLPPHHQQTPSSHVSYPPPETQQQLKRELPTPEPQERSATPQTSTKPSMSVTPQQQQQQTSPSHTSNQPSNVQPQHYTPNLQFRKIWETSNLQTRPRNPSLLFDPLAPAPPATTSHPVTRSGGEFSPTPESQSPNSVHHPQPTNHQQNTIPPPPPQLGGSPYLPNRSDSASSFTSSHDNSARLSIKLPPPSSIHRTSSNLAFPKSPGLKGPVDDTLSYHSHSISSVTEARIMTAKLPRSLPIQFENNPNNENRSGGSSLPASPHGKKPSLTPINSSLHERLRPSLIELHFGSSTISQPNSAPSSLPGSASAASSNQTSVVPTKHSNISGTSVSKIQQDSIGSHSSHNNSIFSNKSSLSSLSSAPRTSSFGSISHHPSWESNKNSFSIGPHDPVPPSSLATIASVTSIVEESAKQEVISPSPINAESSTNESFPFNSPRSVLSSAVSKVTVRPRIYRSLTPPNLHSKLYKSVNSPIPRSSSSLQHSSSGHVINPSLSLVYSNLRSLTNSPLAKSIVNEENESTETSEVVDGVKTDRSKVSVTSLLGDVKNNNSGSKYSNINSIINESEHESDADNNTEIEGTKKEVIKPLEEQNLVVENDPELKRQKLE